MHLPHLILAQNKLREPLQKPDILYSVQFYNIYSYALHNVVTRGSTMRSRTSLNGKTSAAHTGNFKFFPVGAQLRTRGVRAIITSPTRYVKRRLFDHLLKKLCGAKSCQHQTNPANRQKVDK